MNSVELRLAWPDLLLNGESYGPIWYLGDYISQILYFATYVSAVIVYTQLFDRVLKVILNCVSYKAMLVNSEKQNMDLEISIINTSWLEFVFNL